MLQDYFQEVLKAIRSADHDRAKGLLACLNERNEFHIGFSKHESRGRALGKVSAEDIWKSLVRSKAAETALLEDLEDSVLFVDGIGPDKLSDAVCNIIRRPLIAYTQQACNYYGIKLEAEVNSGPLWDSKEKEWSSTLIRLPVTKAGPLILLPKIIVRAQQSYRFGQFYQHYLLPTLQQHHLSINSDLVRVLKSKKNKGGRRVYKKDLADRYGNDKLAAAKATIEHPEALTKFRQDKRRDRSRPLDHSAFAEIENVPVPNFVKLVENVRALKPGKDQAQAYEDAIEKLLTAVLYPSLCSPIKQSPLHEGRKRIDITYVNAAKEGFFYWLAQKYPAPHIFVECKNYGKEIGNPELDQLTGRFSPSRGQVGLLVVRSIENRELLIKRCKDAATDQRGFVLVLEDADLLDFATKRNELLKGNGVSGFGDTGLYRQFRNLVF
ncbi:hypothetical protein [Ahniella affigens]|uniref:hypothetical protein n=1 Tax=Ahniella affigens TaxID=2021234 RepID=UPI001F0B8400|nr:hypothetical protein [Ahniella affigens]